MKDDKTRSLQIVKGSDTAEVLIASQPYGLLSKTTATVVTAITSKVVSMSLTRLEKVRHDPGAANLQDREEWQT